MQIGWLIPTVGMFGAVREMVEVSNVLVQRGHTVTIYHPEGTPCVWLPCRAGYGTLNQMAEDELDVLIGIVDWKPAFYDALVESRARVKAVCLMGFTPSDEVAAVLRGEQPGYDPAWTILRHAILNDIVILADSCWQLEWVQHSAGIETGPPFGGINLAQFCPAQKQARKRLRLLASGDPRSRKGSDTVLAAVDLVREKMGKQVEFDTYWNRRFSQEQLVAFLQQGDIFLDGHRRAGWCNPVAEAMACGTAVVCTDIGAVSDFALHERTALVVPVDNPVAMAKSALHLLENGEERRRLAQAGLERIALFDYNQVVPVLECYLADRVSK